MTKKMTLAALAAASFVMLTTIGHSNAASMGIPNDTLNHNAANPGIDTWDVKCQAKTTICADVLDAGPHNDNTFHVNVVCILPTARKGAADLKFAFAPGQNPSTKACVTNCQEALVSFQCDATASSFCDDQYNSIFECVNKNFASGYPRQTQDED